MIQIPQSTSRVVMLKVFLTGTTTAATGKTVAVVISKAGGAFANPNAGATNATEVSNGWYKITADTTDTGTLGDLVIRGTATGCDDSERIFAVVKATNAGATGIPDAVAGANAGLPVLSSSATTLGYTVSTVTTLTNLPAVTTDWLTAAGVKADAVTKIQTGLATPTNITAGIITTVTNLTNAPTAGDFTATMKTSLSAATPAVTVSDKTGFKLASDGLAAVSAWTVAITGNVTGNLSGSVGSVTGLTASNLDATISSRMATYTQPTGFLAATFPTTVASPTNITAGTISTVTTLTNLPSIPANWLTAAGIASGALVAAVWDGAISGHTTSGTFGGALNAAGSSGDPWNTPLPGAYTSGTAGYILGNESGGGGLDAAGTRAALGMAAANMDTQLAGIGHLADGAITSAKFTVASPSGVATGILERLDQLWRRFFKRVVYDSVNQATKTYADNGTTVLTTQTATSSAGVEELGGAT